ncbi:MAG TPA: 50S ribosomal protein L7/L12 [Fimbriimonas sp.]|nr:50S ribosomal protein L7/L12 [Fimbriimonas sp.]
MPTAVESIVDQISGMTALELSELKKALEDKFGVTAAAPMGAFNPAMFAGAGGGGAAAAPAEEEKTEFDVILTAAGDSKLNVIKVVREITGLGLKEAKDLVDGAPQPVKQAISKDEAEKIKAQITDAGGKVDIK